MEHLITNVRQIGFPGIGAEMEVCAGGLLGGVLTTTTARGRKTRRAEGEVDDSSLAAEASANPRRALRPEWPFRDEPNRVRRLCLSAPSGPAVGCSQGQYSSLTSALSAL